jgi:hypothetical protein
VTASTIVSRILEAEGGFDTSVSERYTAIKRAESFSKEKIDQIRSLVLSSPPPVEASVHLLAAAGSLARKEASEASDLDLIVITEDETEHESSDGPLRRWRADLCSQLGLEGHNPKGIFANPLSLNDIRAGAGSEKEPYAKASIRILTLLESDWILGQDNYSDLVTHIVQEYSADIEKDPRKNFVFLMNDVIRYFRTVCVNYQYTKSETEDGKWPIRNIKLRHSRVLMYFSMIASIGLLSREHSDQKLQALKHLIDLPPLRRLFVCYNLSGDTSFYKVAGLYDVFLDVLSDRESRDELRGLDYGDRYSSRIFAHLKATSDALCSELLRFYEARRHDWDDRFFEYMLV